MLSALDTRDICTPKLPEKPPENRFSAKNDICKLGRNYRFKSCSVLKREWKNLLCREASHTAPRALSWEHRGVSKAQSFGVPNVWACGLAGLVTPLTFSGWTADNLPRSLQTISSSPHPASLSLEQFRKYWKIAPVSSIFLSRKPMYSFRSPLLFEGEGPA